MQLFTHALNVIVNGNNHSRFHDDAMTEILQNGVTDRRMDALSDWSVRIVELLGRSKKNIQNSTHTIFYTRSNTLHDDGSMRHFMSILSRKPMILTEGS